MPLQLTKLKTNLPLNPLFWIVDLTERRECRIPNRPDGEGWRQWRYEAEFGRRFTVSRHGFVPPPTTKSSLASELIGSLKAPGLPAAAKKKRKKKMKGWVGRVGSPVVLSWVGFNDVVGRVSNFLV
ncbi:unnamed protein product [Linum tenue]|uniref:Uncharacterized protein n=1 Tax=Linum tenue TaxID=586396 RepID=A0AAV0HGI4_9ROSI|nr:unnamed protein product [Linum tenue]